jgi:hypothetical protein
VVAVDIVRVELQVGLQLVGEKLQLVPLGNPEQEKLTDCVVPVNKVAVTVVVALSPGITLPKDGLTDKEKSNASSVTVKL